MEKRIVRVAAVQIAPVLDQVGGTLDRVLAAIDEAAGRGVGFAVFPETFLPYYPYFSFIEPPFAIGPAHLKLYDEAVAVPGPVTQALSAAAKRHAMVLVIGVNERDGGSLYNAQLIFDADGTLRLKRRKITPTYHERMIWGQGDGAGLEVIDTAVGRVGALACWEHYNPLARYALMAQGEEIHAAQFPGSLVGPIFAAHVVDWPRHYATLTEFWSLQTGGPSGYAGRLLRVHHALGLRPEFFEIWLAQWRQSCRLHFEGTAADEMIALAERLATRMSEGV